MISASVSTTGLLLATAASVTNVGFEMAAKQAFNLGGFLQTTLRIRVFVAILLTCILFGLRLNPEFRSSISLFSLGWSGLMHSGLLLVLLLSTGLVTVSIMLYYRSLQVAPISVVAPLFGLTPVTIILAGFLIFREIPSPRVMTGVFCILVGSVLAHWRQSLRSPRTAFVSFLKQKGVGTMLGACTLLSITNLLDKWLVMRLDAMSYAWLYVVLCAIFTSILVLILRPGHAQPVPGAKLKWVVFAGVLDSAALLLHFASLGYVEAVVTIAIKRSGMLLAVLAGAIFFKERQTLQRFSAAFVVLMGVLTMYFNLSLGGLLLVLSVGLGCSVVAVLATRTSIEQETELQTTSL